MQKYFSISKTAEIVGMTAETLRHYDRIDLVKPCKIDEWTGYRYYSQQEIVILNTIKALKFMDLTLSEIKEILHYDDFNKIVEVLKQAENKADDKIAELNYAKNKIQRARMFYESKVSGELKQDAFFIKNYTERVILLSKTLDKPSLENLWNYHSNFYNQVSEKIKNEFAFEDLAGIYSENGKDNLFAVCIRYVETDNLKRLPKGNYLCANCTQENRDDVLKKLLEYAKSKYKIVPKFIVQIVVLSGILNWNYQLQIYIEE